MRPGGEAQLVFAAEADDARPPDGHREAKHVHRSGIRSGDHRALLRRPPITADFILTEEN